MDTAPAELFPLSPGTFWVYEVEDFDGDVTLQRVYVRGRRFLEAIQESGVVVEESGGIAGELSLDVSWHPVVYYRRGDFLYKFSGVNYVDHELREFRLGLGEEKVLPTDPIRYPAWENDLEVFHVDPDTGYGLRMYSIAEPDPQPVEVRAGTYAHCLRVETRSFVVVRSAKGRQRIAYRYLDWYAPGVGLVKSIAEVEGAPRPVRISELVSFRGGRED